jgi:Flp pilus assembly protein TadB
MFVGDDERERVATLLREHYVRGRLTLEEFSHRADLVLAARSRGDLRRALAGLSLLPAGSDLPRQARSLARAAGLVALTGIYLMFSLSLLVLLALTLLLHGASAAALVAFLLVWLVPTMLLVRLWHRPPPRRRAGL